MWHIQPALPGVPGGLTVSRVTIEVEIVGSNIARDSFLTNRQAESVRARVGGIRCKSKSIKNSKMGTLIPTRDKNEAKNRGGEGKTPVTTACPEDR